jgi:hypothetical protein
VVSRHQDPTPCPVACVPPPWPLSEWPPVPLIEAGWAFGRAHAPSVSQLPQCSTMPVASKPARAARPTTEVPGGAHRGPGPESAGSRVRCQPPRVSQGGSGWHWQRGLTICTHSQYLPSAASGYSQPASSALTLSEAARPRSSHGPRPYVLRVRQPRALQRLPACVSLRDSRLGCSSTSQTTRRDARELRNKSRGMGETPRTDSDRG